MDDFKDRNHCTRMGKRMTLRRDEKRREYMCNFKGVLNITQTEKNV